MTTKNNEMVKTNESKEMTLPTFDYGFKNQKLTTLTAQIAQAEVKGVQAKLVICATLASIKDMFDASNDFLTEDGFTSCEDYANQMFGYTKTNMYDMIKVGRRFVGDDGKIVAPELQGMSWTQLSAIATLDDVSIAKMLSDGFSPSMSVREVKKLASKYTVKKARKARTPKAPKNEQVQEPKNEQVQEPKNEQ